MGSLVRLEDFETIYQNTYLPVLKYILCKCSKIEDVNDILQNTYVSFYEILKRKKQLKIENLSSYLIGIAKNKISKHYKLKYKILTDSWEENIDVEKENFTIEKDIEAQAILKTEGEKIWEFLKKKKPEVAKIFYLYYIFGLTLSEIAIELEVSESKVKNSIYRTLKEMKQQFRKEEKENG